MASQPKCSYFLCTRPGGLRCTKCRDAAPQTIYCSARCQQADWKFHKEYCGKYAYTFELTLVDSSDPVIKRTFDVPSWYTFRQLHYAIQYSMGPWQCSHMHEFSFNKQIEPGPRVVNQFAQKDEKLKILPTGLYDEEEHDSMMHYLSPNGSRIVRPKTELEEIVKLKDVFDPAGRLYSTVAPQGEIYPLVYIYDFGDHWEHELIFKGQKLARSARPVFISAQGCGPVEDSGGVTGWEEVKAAFRVPAAARTQEHEDSIRWAQNASGNMELDPLKDPSVIQMNYEARWENHLRSFMIRSGEGPPPEPAWVREAAAEDERIDREVLTSAYEV